MKHGHPCGHSSGGAQRRTEIVLTTQQEYEPNDPAKTPAVLIASRGLLGGAGAIARRRTVPGSSATSRVRLVAPQAFG
jgi:hypothetical protein